MAANHALLIGNRACRRGDVGLGGIVERLRSGGVEVETAIPDTADAAAERIRDAPGRYDRVVLAGGDGTLHAAIEPLLEAGLPLGIIPLGTANDLARSLELPLDPLAAAEVIAAGVTHCVDVGRVNGCPFFNAASIGLGVAVTRQLSQTDIKRWWGVFGYARALAGELRGRRSFKVRIECDGNAEQLRSLQITIGNGRFYGGGMAVAAGARVDDGRLFLYSIEPQPIWRLARLLPALRRGDHGSYPEVFMRSARHIRVETRRPKAVTADGELCARTPAVFEIMPAAIPVFVSQEYLNNVPRRVDAQE